MRSADTRLVDQKARFSGRVGTRGYTLFLDELRSADPASDDVNALLDGRAGERCLDLVRPFSVQQLGAFFTPSALASRLVETFRVPIAKASLAFDPACGAADLLLPIARQLPLHRTVSATLREWNKRLAGCDISAEFVEAARLRLALLAAVRGARVDASLSQLARLMTSIYVADGLSTSGGYSQCSHLIMNPPYARAACERTPWREGATTMAALFVERAALLTGPKTEIVALLPEVLRTGSSYQNWREHLSRHVASDFVESVGLFSTRADVDVFIQRFVRVDRPLASHSRKAARRRTIGDRFVVSVGAVVPHRHRRVGGEYAYLHTGNAPAWGRVQRISERRKFEGRTFTPPFVVVRRTSRPGDPHRAVATLVLGDRPVAVENHLLVFTPRRGSIPLCIELMKMLKFASTTRFLNLRMRCRHLTVSSVASVPWP